MSSNLLVAEQVETNLVHYNFWTTVKAHTISDLDDSNLTILSGLPPNKLETNDPEGLREWIIPKPVSQNQKFTIKEINHWFNEIGSCYNDRIRPKRITVGLVNDDATVVYYFIHDGIVKPRQN